MSNISGTGFPRNPVLSTQTTPIETIVDPLSPNLYTAATIKPISQEDPSSFLGTDPRVNNIMTINNSTITTTSDPANFIIISKTANNTQQLDLSTYQIQIPSVYAISPDSAQTKGISSEIIYNIGAKMGSYLSQCDRTNLMYTLNDDQFSYFVSPINDIKISGVYSILWPNSFSPGTLAQTDTPSPTTFPLYNLQNSTITQSYGPISQTNNNISQSALNQAYYCEDYTDKTAWDIMQLGAKDFTVAQPVPLVFYNTQDNNYQLFTTSKSSFLHGHGDDSFQYIKRTKNGLFGNGYTPPDQVSGLYCCNHTYIEQSPIILSQVMSTLPLLPIKLYDPFYRDQYTPDNIYGS